jgi:hypothetical protein
VDTNLCVNERVSVCVYERERERESVCRMCDHVSGMRLGRW